MTNKEAIDFLAMGCPPSNQAMEAVRTLRAALQKKPPPYIVKEDGTIQPLVPKIEGLREAIEQWNIITTSPSQRKLIKVLEAARSYLELSEGE